MDARSVTSRRGTHRCEIRWSTRARTSSRGLLRPVAVAVVLVAVVDLFGTGRRQVLRRCAWGLARGQIAFLVDRIGNAVEHGSVVTKSHVFLRRIAMVVVQDAGSLFECKVGLAQLRHAALSIVAVNFPDSPRPRDIVAIALFIAFTSIGSADSAPQETFVPAILLMGFPMSVFPR
jgi:hypothetical protein